MNERPIEPVRPSVDDAFRTLACVIHRLHREGTLQEILDAPEEDSVHFVKYECRRLSPRVEPAASRPSSFDSGPTETDTPVR